MTCPSEFRGARPGDQRTRGPLNWIEDKDTRGPWDHDTRVPGDLGTREQGNQGTREPGGQGARIG